MKHKVIFRDPIIISVIRMKWNQEGFYKLFDLRYEYVNIFAHFLQRFTSIRIDLMIKLKYILVDSDFFM